MKIKAVDLTNFSVFQNAELHFCPGLNILIGANATGKTHVLKLLYAACSVMPKRNFGDVKLLNVLHTKLRNVFKADRDELWHVIRRGNNRAKISIEFDSDRIGFDIINPAMKRFRSGLSMTETPHFKDEARALFLPSREVLSMFRGFVPAYDEREQAVDETYYDLCKALMHSELKARDPERVRLVDLLQKHLGGAVIFTGIDFYVRPHKPAQARQALRESNGERDMEIQLVSEGLRKLAMLAQLVKNGSIRRNGILFWDEPESSLNPKLIALMAGILRDIAEMGVQIFIATHDYLLTREFSLAVEYKTKPVVDTRFFSFGRQGDSPVNVESGRVLAELDHNPLLDEFEAHYGREQALFYNGGKG